MKYLMRSALVAACLTCWAACVAAESATSGGQSLPKRITADDGGPGYISGQPVPLKQPAVVVPGDETAPAVAITAPASGASFPVDTPVSFSGSFTDESGATHTAQWTFETISAQGVVTEAGGTVSGAWTFGLPGIYHVRLAVTDQAGNVGAASTVGGADAYIVIFDRGDGFVDGNGRFQSPAGALVSDPQAGGRVDFTFDARYRKDDVVPTGSTQFKFTAGSFEFQSTGVYDWFVCFGARALYRGTGTVNGAAGYAFLISAVDGDDIGGGAVDRLRLQVTNKATGAVVYDNQMGAPDTAAATCPLSWGNVNVRLPNGGMRNGQIEAAAAPVQGLARGQDFVQNWPNPFRARTEVRFSLSQRSHVKLGVFDLAGREVATLANGPWDAGSHAVSWAGRTSSGATARGGVYFVRMSGGLAQGEQRFESVRKMILLD